jgi:electron transfer flavoprotein beta subunit
LKVVVCVKQVAVLGDEIEFTPDERDVDPDYLDRALNEWDAAATEEALQIRERLGEGKVVVVSAGEGEAETALRRCLAMGADRAVRVAGRFEDPFTVAHALAEAVKREEPRLVLCGVQSSDSVQAATGTALAELLGLARVAVVTKVELGDGCATVDRELEGGLVDVVEVDLPALLTIQTGINQPRYATLRAIKQAEHALAAEGRGARVPRRTRYAGSASTTAISSEILHGGPAEIAQRIGEIVRERLR